MQIFIACKILTYWNPKRFMTEMMRGEEEGKGRKIERKKSSHVQVRWVFLKLATVQCFGFLVKNEESRIESRENYKMLSVIWCSLADVSHSDSPVCNCNTHWSHTENCTGGAITQSVYVDTVSMSAVQILCVFTPERATCSNDILI